MQCPSPATPWYLSFSTNRGRGRFRSIPNNAPAPAFPFANGVCVGCNWFDWQGWFQIPIQDVRAYFPERPDWVISRHFAHRSGMSALYRLADILSSGIDVRYVPEADMGLQGPQRAIWAHLASV